MIGVTTDNPNGLTKIGVESQGTRRVDAAAWNRMRDTPASLETARRGDPLEERNLYLTITWVMQVLLVIGLVGAVRASYASRWTSAQGGSS